MEGKKVLILTYYWPPAGGVAVQRWLKFALYLADKGWKPVIFTADQPDYPIRNEQLMKQVPRDMEVHFIPIPEPRKWLQFLSKKKKKGTGESESNIDGLFYIKPEERTSGQKLILWIRANLFVPDARVLWVPKCVKYISSYIKTNGGDFLVTTGPPHSTHLSGLRIRKQTGIKWIADFRDPWTDIEYFDFLPLTAKNEKKHFAMERAVVSTADGVITVSPYWNEKFKAYHAKKITVLTNGYDPRDFISLKEQKQSHFIISHTGTIQGDRFPADLLMAIKELFEENPEWRKEIKLILAGKMDRRLTSLIQSYDLDDITEVSGIITHQEALQLMINSSLLLLLVNRVERNAKGRMTGKLFEYLYVKKPILMIGPDHSDPAEIIRKTHSGYICEWNDVDGIKEVIAKEFFSYKAGKRHQDVVGIDQFSREKLTDRLIEFFSSLN